MRTGILKNFYIRSGIFVLLSLCAAVLNYLLYPVLTRMLTASDFGDFAAIVAISGQVLGFLLALNIISINLVKTQSEDTARKHVQFIQKVLVWFFILLTMAVMLASPFLKILLKIDNINYFVLLGIVLIVSIPGVIWTGFLQGHKELIRIGSFNLSAAVMKLMMATVLAWTYGTVGALWGLVVGTTFGLIIILITPGVRLPKLRSIFARSDSEEKKYIWSLRSYFLECLFVVGGMGLLQNYDITLAKALFGPESAGLYSGISVLSNSLYYFAFLLVWIILPEVQLNNHSSNMRLLGTAYKSLFLVSSLSIIMTLLIGPHIVRILLGGEFVKVDNILVFAVLYQLTLVAIVIYAYYLLVIRSKRAAVLGGLVISTAVLIPAIFANSPLQMAQLLWFSLLIGVGLYWILSRVYGLRKKATY